MRNNLILACLLFLSFHKIIAQEKLPEFGKIDVSDLTMNECVFEKAADAMYLIKTAKITFEINAFTGVPSINTEYRVRIKIFNERGFSAANIKIPYISKSRSSKITDIEAFIYSLDDHGRIDREKVERKQIINEKSKAERAVNYVGFTFPNLKKGSVIEYRYTRIDKNSLRVEPWLFQDPLPTAFSKIIAYVPAYVKMRYHVLTFNPVEKDSSYKKYYRTIYNEDIRSFTVRNIHSFKIEPLMSSLKDNLQRVEFSISPPGFLETLFSSSASRWGIFNAFLLRAPFFGYQIKQPIEGTGPFIDSVKKLTRAEDKIAAVYKYVRQHVDWNGEHTFYCDSLNGCWKNKSGSNGEMNMLLLNFLQKVGVNSFPLLVSTRENGNPDQDFPSLSQFNGVDVLAMRDSSSYYIIDCTQKYLSFNIPPYNVLNSNAYIIDDDKNGWVFITDPRILMKNEVAINAGMDSSGNISGVTRLSYIGFAKSETLEELRKKKDKSDADTEEPGIIDNTPDIIVDSVITELDSADNDTLVRRANFHFTPSGSGNHYFLNPFLFSSFHKNPFKDTARFSDIDFGCNQSYYCQIRINIPRNFSIESMPPNTAIQMHDSSILFDRKIFIDGADIIIRTFFVIKTAVFSKEDYASLKSFFDRFYGLLNEEILLKKKG